MAEDFAFFQMHAEAEAYTQREVECYELWGDNLTTYSVFNSLSSQWRIVAGFGGIIRQGLDYGVIKDTLILMGIKRAEWVEVFEGLRVMEAAALRVFQEKESNK